MPPTYEGYFYVINDDINLLGRPGMKALGIVADSDRQVIKQRKGKRLIYHGELEGSTIMRKSHS